MPGFLRAGFISSEQSDGGSGGGSGGAIDVSALPSATLSSLHSVMVYDPATYAPLRASVRDFAVFLQSTAALLHPRGHAPNPMPTAKMDILAVGANQQFGELADAVAWANPGATINMDDGVYYTPFHCEVPDLTIQSVSGNPYRCYLDGEGGFGGGKRLAYGKGMIHITAPFTMNGVGFRHCGGLKSGDEYSSEAGLYIEGFASLGDVRLYHCAFDGNGNGIFIPQGNGQNIRFYEKECLFAGIESNSLSSPTNGGPSHDHYITPLYAEIDGSINYGNVNGHCIKCEAPTLVVKNCPWIASWGGRAIEAAFGGSATITNCTLVSRGDYIPNYGNAPGNFMGYADQVNDRAASGTTMNVNGCTVYAGRGGDYGGVLLVGFQDTIAFANTTLKWFNGGYGMGFVSFVQGNGGPGASVTGIQLGPPTAGDPNILGAPPTPPPIPSWAFV